MSYKRRMKHKAMLHEWYDSPSGNEEAMSTAEDLAFNYEPGFPGPREIRTVDAQNFRHSLETFDPDIHDYVDWAAGGVPGFTKTVGSVGVTDPATVDRHDFIGQMAVVRRFPDTNYGPVKTSDHNSILSLLYAMQESSHYFPNEVSQRDILKAV